MTRLRFIVVGLGARAQFWLRVLNESDECEVVGLVDPRVEVHTRAQALCPSATIGTDFASIVGEVEADVALLCTPPFGREKQMEVACQAGLAILAEKPLAESVDKARRYVEMTEQAGVMLMVGLNYRFLPVTAETRRLFDEQIGQPEFARFTYQRWRDGKLPHLNRYPLTMTQPMLWEQSIHHFDLMRFVYQAEPVRVFAKSFNPSWSMYADDANVSAVLEFSNGIIVNYQGTWQSNWGVPNFEWRHECLNGIVIQRDQYGELAFAERDQAVLTPVALPPYELWINDATALLRSFVAAYRGEAPLQCTGRDHLSSLRMIEACVRSSETGQSVIPAELEK
ncbi:Gfo/Idh/MocA family oxidoreductase [Mesorhizobium sp. WSM4887]|uniref:Gfo/Idh/MocA family protein n=1 Tax=Mesorhizobium sp. WSM4887 TaxID=3038543 RepID=UPI002417FFAD|nr:Gfo/Idh/MocA family oxidoreductase [Mesorhizobium sp. WSM4887]MDG4889755.1 Gfo/Idh/MocA family oxidoreductase [Mesorhizobium sp. WSM4887]